MRNFQMRVSAVTWNTDRIGTGQVGWWWRALQAAGSRGRLWRGVTTLLVGWQEGKDPCKGELAGAKDRQKQAKNWRAPGRGRRAGARRVASLVGGGKHAGLTLSVMGRSHLEFQSREWPSFVPTVKRLPWLLWGEQTGSESKSLATS